MSRIEATIPEPRLAQVKHLEEELGLTKSQIVEEAIGLFFKAVLEIRQGHRVGFVANDRKSLVVEFTSPALSQVEWAAHRAPLTLSNRGFDRMQRLVDKPPAPVAALKAAVARRRKS